MRIVKVAEGQAKKIKTMIKGAGGVAENLVFGSEAKSALKLQNQMDARGRAQTSVKETVAESFTTRASTNATNKNPATAYFNLDGSYVVVDNLTHEVVQVSNRLDPNWIPDARIVDPYIPKQENA